MPQRIKKVKYRRIRIIRPFRYWQPKLKKKVAHQPQPAKCHELTQLEVQPMEQCEDIGESDTSDSKPHQIDTETQLASFDEQDNPYAFYLSQIPLMLGGLPKEAMTYQQSGEASIPREELEENKEAMIHMPYDDKAYGSQEEQLRWEDKGHILIPIFEEQPQLPINQFELFNIFSSEEGEVKRSRQNKSEINVDKETEISKPNSASPCVYTLESKRWSDKISANDKNKSLTLRYERPDIDCQRIRYGGKGGIKNNSLTPVAKAAVLRKEDTRLLSNSPFDLDPTTIALLSYSPRQLLDFWLHRSFTAWAPLLEGKNHLAEITYEELYKETLSNRLSLPGVNTLFEQLHSLFFDMPAETVSLNTLKSLIHSDVRTSFYALVSNSLSSTENSVVLFFSSNEQAKMIGQSKESMSVTSERLDSLFATLKETPFLPALSFTGLEINSESIEKRKQALEQKWRPWFTRKIFNIRELPE